MLFLINSRETNELQQKYLTKKISRKKDKIWFKKWKLKIAKLCNTNVPFSFEWCQIRRFIIRKSLKLHLSINPWVYLMNPHLPVRLCKIHKIKVRFLRTYFKKTSSQNLQKMPFQTDAN